MQVSSANTNATNQKSLGSVGQVARLDRVLEEEEEGSSVFANSPFVHAVAGKKASITSDPSNDSESTVS